jgi:hypothetical protein
MALKNPLMIKTVLGTGNLTLKADPGEAFLVKDILVRDPVANYLQVKIEKALVGYFRVGGNLGGHQNFRRGRAQHSHTVRIDDGSGVASDHNAPLRDSVGTNRKLLFGKSDAPTGDVYDEVRALMWSGYHLSPSVLAWLFEKGIFKGFPVAEGETLSLDAYKDANTIQMVIYEQYEPGDIKPDQENGSMSAEYFFLNYGNCGGNVNTTGDTKFSTSKSPAEFPSFPFGEVVPAKHEITIYGILGSTFTPKENDGTNYCSTKWIKLVKDRETLFDEDRNGLLFWARNNEADGRQDMIAEGFSLIGGLSEKDNTPPFMFPEPLVFGPGDELSIYLNTISGGTGQNIAIDEHEICLIEKVRRIE